MDCFAPLAMTHSNTSFRWLLYRSGSEEAESTSRSAEPPRSTPALTDRHGLLHRSVPDRVGERGVAVSGCLGPVDHLRRHAYREFRAWRLLYARCLCRVHPDRAVFGRLRFLGRHRSGGADRRARRCPGRDAAVAADLSCAGTVSTARDLRPDPDGRGSRGADLGAQRSARSPRAGLQGRGGFLRPEHPEL